jgi:hypothetical protein
MGGGMVVIHQIPVSTMPEQSASAADSARPGSPSRRRARAVMQQTG